MDDDSTTALPDDRWAAVRARDAGWVAAAAAGDPDAFGKLYDAWFDRAYEVALRIVRDRDVAAECAQDTFLAVWRNLATLQDPNAFGGWVLRIARNNALNRSERERRSTAVDEQGLAMIEAYGGAAGNAPDGFRVEDRLGRAASPEAAVEDGDVRSLVWEAAATLGERDLEVLDLSLRHGLTPAEIGDIVGINRNAANQLLHRVRGRLETAIRARVLWRGGAPDCADLAAALRTAGVWRFDAEAVKVAERHVPQCAVCSERQGSRLQPSALFASVPIVLAPIFLKQQAAAALEAAGVPMGGSAFGSAAAGSGAAGGGGSGSSGSGSSGGGSGGSSSSGPGPGGGSTGTSGPAVGPASSAPTQPLTAIAGPGSPPPAGSTADLAAARAARASRQRSIAALAGTSAVAVLLAALLAFLVLRPEDPTTVQAAAGGPTSSAASTTRAGGSSTTAAAGPTTTGGGPIVDPTAPPVDPTSPTVDPTAPPTTRPGTSSTSTSSTTTTTVPPPVLTLTMDPTSATQPWAVAAGPVLTWSVKASVPVTVLVSGPGNGQTAGFRSTAPSGTQAVCPGTINAGICSSPDGTFTYELVVTGPGGSTWRTSASLTVTTPPVIIR